MIQLPQFFPKSRGSCFTNLRELFRRSLGQAPGRELHCHLRPAPWAVGRRAQARAKRRLGRPNWRGGGGVEEAEAGGQLRSNLFAMSRQAKDDFLRHYTVSDPRTHSKGYTEYKVTAQVGWGPAGTLPF